jgi:ABC-2 type transport system ATP-binding protein
MDEQAIIKIDDLHVSYGKAIAVNGISLTIYAGECFGLLGPNGAGKTTTLSCLEGLRRPNHGTITVKGLDVQKNSARVKRMLGVQLQDTALFPDLNCANLVELLASFSSVFLSRQQILDHLERFDLKEKAKAKADQLSGGQRQRLALALAIVHNPDIVVLDEPTVGLDPQARHNIWENIRQIREQGHTVILTTHAMEEAEALCGRVGIIDHGKILALDTPQNLITQVGETSILKAKIELNAEQVEQVKTFSGVQAVTYRDLYLEVQTHQPQELLAYLQQIAIGASRSLHEVNLRQPNLEDAFLKLTGRAIRD